MIRSAVASRLFQFCAGPETHRFYACQGHAARLATDSPSSVFLLLVGQPIRAEDEDDDIDCDYCRGEDGP